MLYFLIIQAAGEVRGPDCEGRRQLVAVHSQLRQIHKVLYTRCATRKVSAILNLSYVTCISLMSQDSCQRLAN